MIKELEEVREALHKTVNALEFVEHFDELNELEGQGPTVRPAIDRSNQALATVNRILNQDEAEMVEKAKPSVYKAYSDYMNAARYPDGNEQLNAIIKAAIRALGLMKEGE